MTNIGIHQSVHRFGSGFLSVQPRGEECLVSRYSSGIWCAIQINGPEAVFATGETADEALDNLTAKLAS